MHKGEDAQGSVEPKRRELIRALFADLPDSFEDRHAALIALRDCFQENLASSLQSPLNQFVAQQPQRTYADRTTLSSRVNEVIRGVGLGLRCPKTGAAGILVADIKDADHPDVPRFRISLRNEAGKSVRGFTTRGPLPALTLVPDDPWKHWWQRRRDQRSGETERG